MAVVSIGIYVVRVQNGDSNSIKSSRTFFVFVLAYVTADHVRKMISRISIYRHLRRSLQIALNYESYGQFT